MLQVTDLSYHQLALNEINRYSRLETECARDIHNESQPLDCDLPCSMMMVDVKGMIRM